MRRGLANFDVASAMPCKNRCPLPQRADPRSAEGMIEFQKSLSSDTLLPFFFIIVPYFCFFEKSVFDNLQKIEDRLLEGPYVHHFVEIMGDYTKEIKEFCKFFLENFVFLKKNVIFVM